MILFAGDKRTDMSEDLVVMPTSQLFGMLRKYREWPAGSYDWDSELLAAMMEDD